VRLDVHLAARRQLDVGLAQFVRCLADLDHSRETSRPRELRRDPFNPATLRGRRRRPQDRDESQEHTPSVLARSSGPKRMPAAPPPDGPVEEAPERLQRLAGWG
jgi:hypothetical protein